jgi:hypothetical protein
MKSVHDWKVDLKAGLTTGEYDERAPRRFRRARPCSAHRVREVVGVQEPPSTRPIGPEEVGIAEPTHG